MKPACQYGSKCYRKNPAHFMEFDHPHLDGKHGNSMAEDLNIEDDAVSPKRRRCSSVEGASSSVTLTSVKVEATDKTKEFCSSNQMGFYVTKVRGIESRWNSPDIAISIRDILTLDEDKFERSFQFNYMVDVDWLILNYPSTNRSKPLDVIYNKVDKEDKDFLQKNNLLNVHLHGAKLPIAYGTHHTKMMILLYSTGLRVVIHTANLIEQDWDQKTQGAFISPLLPKHEDEMKDSETRFGSDLINYLESYKLSVLDNLCKDLKFYDYRAIKVFLISSTPGRFLSPIFLTRGHMKFKTLLKSHCECDHDWPVIGQFSSIGSLGSSPSNWLASEFLDSLKANTSTSGLSSKKPKFSLIFPCEEDVRLSLEGYPAGASLPYSQKTAEKQIYLNGYLHKWSADHIGRTRASPHIKTYCRISSDFTKMAWFLVTSANLSKAAWGVFEKQQSQLMVRSYELGVLFVPQYFGLESFGLNGSNKFLLPFDVPLTKYDPTDEPWMWDKRHTKKPDSHGNMWTPS